MGVSRLRTGSAIDCGGQKLGRKFDTASDNSEMLIVPLEKYVLVIGNIGLFSKIRFLKYGTIELKKNIAKKFAKEPISIDFLKFCFTVILVITRRHKILEINVCVFVLALKPRIKAEIKNRALFISGVFFEIAILK
jgi:hypothetical protein